MTLDSRHIGLLVWAAGTAVVVFFLALGFRQLFQEIPSYTVEDFSAKILKGSSPVGFKLAYFGTALLVAGQFYTLGKTAAEALKAGIGSRTGWLRVHCYFDVAGSILLLLHSGFPLGFRYANPFPYLRLSWGIIGLAGIQGLAAWLVLVILLSGLLGQQLCANTSRHRLLTPWFKTHILLTCLLFVCGTTHLYIVLWLKYVSAG